MAKIGKGALTRGIGGSIMSFLFVTAIITFTFDFWILPYLFSGVQYLTAQAWIAGVLALSPPALLLLAAIAGWWFGYITISFAKRRR